MKAVIFEQVGQAEEVLTVAEVAAPVPEAGELLIQVSVRPIHPADFMFIAGRYRVKPVFPQVAGFDGVGTIVACGPGVQGFSCGERVAFRSPGAWGELVTAPVGKVYRVPAAIADEIACQFPLNPLTAWGLLASCNLQSGGRVLITAGHSVVARLLTTIALRKGLEPFLLVREAVGYRVIDGASEQNLATGATVNEALQGMPGALRFQAILDAVGGAATPALIDVIEPGGCLITYGVLDDTPLSIKSSILLFKNLRWLGFGVDAWLKQTSPEQLAAASEELWTLLEEQPGLLPVIGAFPLEQFPEAVAAVRSQREPGKILLQS